MTKKLKNPYEHAREERHAERLVKQLRNTQEQAEMETLRQPEALRMVSLWTVPDLTFRGYRYPDHSRQFIITLNQAISKKDFSRLVKHAIDMEG